MAIIERTSSRTFGSSHFNNERNQSYSSEGIFTRDSINREGTGRRPKPVVPDVTGYKFNYEKLIAPSIVGGWKAGAQFEECTGLLPLFASSNFPTGLQASGFSSNAKNIALVKALSKLDQRDLDLGTAWAERGKTAQLLGDIASKTVKTIFAARKGHGREILDIWGLNHKGARGKGVVDSYLAYHYGVKPALQDVSGLVGALTRMPPGNWSVRSKGAMKEVTQKTTQVGLGSLYPYLNHSFLERSCRVVVTANKRILSPREDIMWSLGLDNTLGTAWELTPWSFVVDWMFPVGDYLSALNSRKYYEGWLVVTSQWRKETCTFEGSSGKVGKSIFCQNRHVSEGFYEKIDLDRTVSNGPPMPGFPVKDPRSIDHMAKALALLASTLAGGVPRHVRY